MKNIKQTAIFLAARSGSKRLPNKHFLKLNDELMSIDLCIKRLTLSKQIKNIFLCTTKLTSYEQLKNMTQGTEITQSSIVAFVKLLRLPKEEKDKLIALTPEEYIGIAPKLSDIK